MKCGFLLISKLNDDFLTVSYTLLSEVFEKSDFIAEVDAFHPQ